METKLQRSVKKVADGLKSRNEIEERIQTYNSKIADLKKQSAKTKIQKKIGWYIVIGIAGIFTLVIAWILLFYID